MKKVVISGMIGNALEWYDYALFAQFFGIIGQTFFPSSEIKDILTSAVFAAGFIIRPLGGIFFGYIGDKLGRRSALAIGILSMAIPTAGIGLLPGYATIGLAAPIILTIIRLIQGFSLGGEFSGCIAYIVEHSPVQTRGLSGSAAFVSMCGGMLLGLATAKFFVYIMDPEALINWGWRVPFIMGLFIGGIGFYIRSNLAESPVYKAAKESGRLSRFPLKEIFSNYSLELIVAISIYITVTAPFYTATVYIENLMVNIGYAQTESSTIGAVILITLMCTFPISAAISDRIGRRPVLIFSTIALIILIYPIFISLGSMNFNKTLITQIVLAIIVGTYMGPVPTLLVELFPTRVRFTGVALSYNLSAAIFGGTIPLVGNLLTKWTGNTYALSYYLIVLAIFTLFILKFYKETYKKDLKGYESP